MIDRTLSIAPMMDCTDRHYRYFMRLISPNTLLYTEMVTTGAVIHGDRDYLLGYAEQEHPIALQLGGSNPADLAQCTQIAEQWGYDEVNLNVGCPSDRVQAGRFGACLMKEPGLVAECVASMRDAVRIPVTVKTRIGVDDCDSYLELCNFIRTVAATGCDTFILHARKAWLKGLSPKENRNIPPLHYDVVYQLKQDFPDLEIIINGGIKETAAVTDHLQHVDGVMIGREAYRHPYWFAQLQQQLFANDQPLPSEYDILKRYIPYMIQQLAQGVPMRRLVRHLVGVFQGKPGARQWRRFISEQGGNTDLGADLITQGLELVRQ